MKNKYKIMIFLAVFLLRNSIVQAYCPPYFAKIDSIKNGKNCLSIKATSGCGGEVEVINHCSGEFYFYDANGNLNENVVMVNNEEWNHNDNKKYQQLEEKTGKNYEGFDYIHPSGKNWTIRIFSKEDGRDIIVTGYTADESVSIDKESFNVSIFLFALSVILLLAKYGLKKKIRILIPIILIIFGIFFLLQSMSPY